MILRILLTALITGGISGIAATISSEQDDFTLDWLTGMFVIILLLSVMTFLGSIIAIIWIYPFAGDSSTSGSVAVGTTTSINFYDPCETFPKINGTLVFADFTTSSSGKCYRVDATLLGTTTESYPQ